MTNSLIDALEAYLPNAVKNYRKEYGKINEQYKECDSNPGVRVSDSGGGREDQGTTDNSIQQVRHNEHNKQ